ncbi:MAG TPA: Asp-tRNA(Asn)/Glu-tRNA(Gln) amidotransferase subunit GatA [Vicinamibacteria bacterium]|nr:Asp-tRNA(Asn)/Glu-tRNA(Gln) amidotransferase subunit GatA [Vicinamibacteria bacterium]
MSALFEASAAEIRRRVAGREVSCEEVVRAHLERIAAVEAKVGAFLLTAPERALARARSLDRALATGMAAPPLAGVPVAIKDVLHVDGLPTTCGSRILESYRPLFTATAVARLEANGAVVLGKTNMDEFAMGSSTEHSAYQPTRNPWDPGRVPGGSSGGSAAAVAARLAPIALGSDTGGSIRQPAALCGVVGLKPTYGRVSRYGLVAFASSLDQVGPFTRTVEDTALVASVVCGHDPSDATSATAPVPRFEEAVRQPVDGLKVGVPRRFLEKGVEAGTMARFEAALGALTASGALLTDVELPSLPHAVATYYLVATAEASSNLARYDGVRYGLRAGDPADLLSLYGDTRDRGFGPEVKRRIILGTFALSAGYYDAYYLRAQRVRTLIRRDFERAFAGCDAVATPTTPTPAFRFGEKTADPLQMYLEDIFTVPANLAGLPGLSVPCGLVDGLPVGLQLLGRPFEEATLLRLGAAYQRASGHHLLQPSL